MRYMFGGYHYFLLLQNEALYLGSYLGLPMLEWFICKFSRRQDNENKNLEGHSELRKGKMKGATLRDGKIEKHAWEQTPAKHDIVRTNKMKCKVCSGCNKK